MNNKAIYLYPPQWQDDGVMNRVRSAFQKALIIVEFLIVITQGGGGLKCSV